MGDDSVTMVVLLCIPFLNFAFFPYLTLRYLQISHKVNGRQMPWYEALFVLFFGAIGPMIVQINLNEYITRRLRQKKDASGAAAPAAPAREV